MEPLALPARTARKDLLVPLARRVHKEKLVPPVPKDYPEPLALPARMARKDR